MTPSNSSASISDFDPGDIVTHRYDPAFPADQMVVIGENGEYVVVARVDGDTFSGDDDEYYRGYLPWALVRTTPKPTVEDLAYAASEEVDDYVKSLAYGDNGLWCETLDVITTACLAAITEALADA